MTLDEAVAQIVSELITLSSRGYSIDPVVIPKLTKDVLTGEIPTVRDLRAQIAALTYFDSEPANYAIR